MVLWHTQRIRIARWKERLQILLDVVPSADTVEGIEHAQRIIAPVGRLGYWQIVDAANLVQIDEIAGRLNDGERRLDIEGWLQRNPGENAARVKGLEGGDAIVGGCGVTLPFSRKALIERGEGRGKGIAVGPIQVMIAPGPRAGLGQDAERKPVLDKNLDGWTSEGRVERVVRVRGEAKT
jgi:hypothetical protein